MFSLQNKIVKLVFFLIIILLSLSFGVERVYAQVVVNEVLPNPAGNDDGAEWVELYNLGQAITPLSDCVLYLHETNNNQKVVFTQEDFIEKFKVISWDDSWLNNGGDKVRLECSSFSDYVAYGDASGSVVSKPDEGITFGRSPDGTGQFSILSAVTLNDPNSLPPTATPDPTATFTPSPKPTKAPTNTTTAKPTKIQTQSIKTKTDTPTLSSEMDEKSENEVIASEGGHSEVLGIQEVDALSFKLTPTPSEYEEKGGSRFPLLAGIFILGGAGLIGLAIYPIFIKRRLGYNLKDEEGS